MSKVRTLKRLYQRDIKDEMQIIKHLIRKKPKLVPGLLWRGIVAIVIPGIKYLGKKEI